MNNYTAKKKMFYRDLKKEELLYNKNNFKNNHGTLVSRKEHFSSLLGEIILKLIGIRSINGKDNYMYNTSCCRTIIHFKIYRNLHAV